MEGKTMITKLFYDIEILDDYFSLTVFDGETAHTYDLDSVEKYFLQYYRDHKHQIVLIGYNNKSFDDIILEDILNNPEITIGELVKLRNDLISTSDFSANKRRPRGIPSIDLFIEYGKVGNLKQFIGFYEESSESFKWNFDDFGSIEKIKQADLLEKWAEYEKLDVIILKKLWNEWKVKGMTLEQKYQELVEQLPDINSIEYSYIETTFAKHKFTTKNKSKNLTLPSILKDLDAENNELLTNFKHMKGSEKTDNKGGVHLVVEGYVGEGIFTDIDVASMYPNIMLKNPEIVGGVVDLDFFRAYVEKRLELKKAKDPAQMTYKIMINSVFGKLEFLDPTDFNGNRVSPKEGYGKLIGDFVTKKGQNIILRQAKHLQDQGFEIISVNTDGILVKGEPTIDNILADGYEYEFSKYSKLWIKNSNNYLIQTVENEFKSKGQFKIWKTGDFLKSGNSLFYSNTTLSKMFGLQIEEVDYYISKDGTRELKPFMGKTRTVKDRQENEPENYEDRLLSMFLEDFKPINNKKIKQLIDYLDQPNINFFRNTWGEDGKKNFKNNESPKSIDAIYNYEKARYSLAIQSSTILIIDIDADCSEIAFDSGFVIRNPRNNHAKLIFPFYFKKPKKKDQEIITEYFKKRYNINGNVEYKQSNRIPTRILTPFQDVLEPDNGTSFDFGVFEFLEKKGKHEKEELSTTNYDSNISPYLKYLHNFTYRDSSGDNHYFDCPDCKKQGKRLIKIDVEKAKIWINSCYSASCKNHGQPPRVLPLKLLNYLNAEIENNDIVKNLIGSSSGDLLVYPTGSGKTHALAVIFIYYTIIGKKTLILTGIENESVDVLKDRVFSIYREHEPTKNLIPSKIFTDYADVIIKPFHYLTPKLSMDALKLPDYVVQVINKERELIIDEYAEFEKAYSKTVTYKSLVKKSYSYEHTREVSIVDRIDRKDEEDNYIYTHSLIPFSDVFIKGCTFSNSKKYTLNNSIKLPFLDQLEFSGDCWTRDDGEVYDISNLKDKFIFSDGFKIKDVHYARLFDKKDNLIREDIHFRFYQQFSGIKLTATPKDGSLGEDSKRKTNKVNLNIITKDSNISFTSLKKMKYIEEVENNEKIDALLVSDAKVHDLEEKSLKDVDVDTVLNHQKKVVSLGENTEKVFDVVASNNPALVGKDLDHRYNTLFYIQQKKTYIVEDYLNENHERNHIIQAFGRLNRGNSEETSLFLSENLIKNREDLTFITQRLQKISQEKIIVNFLSTEDELLEKLDINGKVQKKGYVKKMNEDVVLRDFQNLTKTQFITKYSVHTYKKMRKTPEIEGLTRGG